MSTADVVVIGAGLAGLTAAIRVAESGARVHVLAKGHAATHWGPGGIDVAGIPAASTPRDGIRRLAGEPGHPYAFLGDDVAAALEWIRPHLAAGGVEYLGDLDTPLGLVPTSIVEGPTTPGDEPSPPRSLARSSSDLSLLRFSCRRLLLLKQARRYFFL